MQQRLVFEQHAVPGSLPDVAQRLAMIQPLARQSVCDRMCARSEATSSGGCDVLILDTPVVYWMRSQQEPSVMTHYRQFARGNTLVAAVERPGVGCDVEATIVWPYQQLLAGECQFSQLMRTIFGNFGETGFDAPSTAKPLVPYGTKLPVHSPPTDMNVPMHKRRMMCTNLDMKETAFLTEALCSDPSAGHGTRLAELRLWNGKVSHALMEGVIARHPLHLLHAHVSQRCTPTDLMVHTNSLCNWKGRTKNKFQENWLGTQKHSMPRTRSLAEV